MKYIYYILAIIISISVGLAYSIFDKSGERQEYAMIINDKVISQDELQQMSANKNENLNDDEFIKSIIMKELLIQEARRTGIDREESFRRSIQNYYEQSLTKILLDRKMSEFAVKASKQEIDRYLDLSGREISITLISRSAASLEETYPSGTKNDTVETELTDVFDNYSNEIKISLLPLHVGAKIKAKMNYGDEVVIQLNSVGQKTEPQERSLTRDEANRLISDHKRQQEINAWMDGLRVKAAISIKKNETI